MSINLPDYSTIVERTRADIKQLLEDLDPTIFASLSKAIADSNSGRHYDNVLSIKQLEKELFPDTASRDVLERWAAYEGLTPFPAEQAQGNVVVTGTAGAVVAVDQEYQTDDGKLYTVSADKIIALNTITVTSLTRSGTTVTAITGSAHGFATNLLILMAGAVETDYNGSVQITVLSETTFSYEITGTPTTPATGTITASCTCASIPLTSNDTGLDQNLDSGATLTSVDVILNVDRTGYVDFTGVIGGQDAESTSSLLNRTIQSRSNPVANFNVAAITKQSLLIQGVTRVKVKRITPRIGAVTVLFVRDEDDNIIPSVSQRNEVNDSILEILQASSEESDVHTPVLTGISTDYIFSSISPNTPTMQTAINNNIQAMYEDDVTFETDISEDKYRSAIVDTIDPDTGDKLLAFALSAPTGDIAIGTDEIGIPGSISF